VSIVRRVLPAAALFVALAAGKAHAIPILQLYVEGATYNTTTESWDYTAPGSSTGESFRIWTIGNISGQGGKGPIDDVKLSAVYDIAVGDITITLTPTRVGGDGDYTASNGYTFTDQNTPVAPTRSLTTDTFAEILATEGTTPLLGDGETPLPAHGEYGDDRIWQEFQLGDFNLADAPIGDFISSFPQPSTGGPKAQINVYDVVVTGDFGEHPFTIHFDLYNHIGGENHAKYKFAPFSHDAGGEPGDDVNVNIVPEPASASLFGLACLSVFGSRCLRRRRKSAKA
jgi:hypothetical protein